MDTPFLNATRSLLSDVAYFSLGRLMNRRTNLSVVVALSAAVAFTVSTPVTAFRPSSESLAVLDQRVKDIDVSLSELGSALTKQPVAEAQRAELLQLQQSLETEKRLLIERKDLLERLERKGLLIYVAP